MTMGRIVILFIRVRCRVEVPRNCGTKRWLIGIEGSAVKFCNAKNTL